MTARRSRCSTRCGPRSCRWTGWRWAASRTGRCSTRCRGGCARSRRTTVPGWSGSGSRSARTPSRTRSSTRAPPACTGSGWTGRCSSGRRPAASGPRRGGWTPSAPTPTHEVVEIGSYEELRSLPEAAQASARYFLLSHHEDPITRFEPALAVQQPAWLGPAETRPTGVPRHARWYPIATFFLTLIDTKNAMDVVPGTFVARGHDYRADLARMVSVAYGLPVDEDELLRIERALRRREAEWAERRLVAEQLQRAREAVQREVSTWGTGKEPALVGRRRGAALVRLTPSVRPALSARGRTAARASRGRWSPSAAPSRRTRCR